MLGENTHRLIAAIRIGLGALAASLLISVSANAGPPEPDDVLSLRPDNFFSTVGHATLIRTPNGVNMNIWTTDLDDSAVYTVWWVLLPSSIGEGEFCVMWATGHPVGPTETGHFAARLNEGEPWPFAEPSEANGGAGPCGGLVNAQTQPIWAVLRTHGPIIPEMVYEQMSTYLGGCADDDTDPNFCWDQQIIFFADP